MNCPTFNWNVVHSPEVGFHEGVAELMVLDVNRCLPEGPIGILVSANVVGGAGRGRWLRLSSHPEVALIVHDSIST
jgi:hypothetical protein